MLLIINLGIILSLLFIVIFDVVNLKEQIMCTILILITIIMFKLNFSKMIKSNKNNQVGTLKKDVLHKVTLNQIPSCKNIFNLKNIDLILIDLKNISRKGQQIKKDSTLLTSDNLEFIDKVNTKQNNMLLNKYSGNKDFNFKDLHNTIISKNLNTSEKGSLLLNNVDCSNDNTCIV